MKITGNCTCCGIRYEASRQPLLAYNCHCPDCQAWSTDGHVRLISVLHAIGNF